MNDSNYFCLSDEEAKAIYSFFLKCGYISYEFDMPVILLIRRLAEYLEEKNDKNIQKME